jgi:hypothetical protein
LRVTNANFFLAGLQILRNPCYQSPFRWLRLSKSRNVLALETCLFWAFERLKHQKNLVNKMLVFSISFASLLFSRNDKNADRLVFECLKLQKSRGLRRSKSISRTEALEVKKCFWLWRHVFFGLSSASSTKKIL